MQRGFRDATGQLIVDHDDGMDNLSDKEIYARNIPAIGIWYFDCNKLFAKYLLNILPLLKLLTTIFEISEITRDSISEFDAYSDEDYETGGRYGRRHHGAHPRRRGR